MGPSHCTIPCTKDHGTYKDVLDGDDGIEPLTPIISCVHEVSSNSYMVYMGYDNANPHNVYIAVGPDNMFSSGVQLPDDYRPPSKFKPGAHEVSFSVG